MARGPPFVVVALSVAALLAGCASESPAPLPAHEAATYDILGIEGLTAKASVSFDWGPDESVLEHDSLWQRLGDFPHRQSILSWVDSQSGLVLRSQVLDPDQPVVESWGGSAAGINPWGVFSGGLGISRVVGFQWPLMAQANGSWGHYEVDLTPDGRVLELPCLVGCREKMTGPARIQAELKDGELFPETIRIEMPGLSNITYVRTSYSATGIREPIAWAPPTGDGPVPSTPSCDGVPCGGAEGISLEAVRDSVERHPVWLAWRAEQDQAILVTAVLYGRGELVDLQGWRIEYLGSSGLVEFWGMYVPPGVWLELDLEPGDPTGDYSTGIGQASEHMASMEEIVTNFRAFGNATEPIASLLFLAHPDWKTPDPRSQWDIDVRFGSLRVAGSATLGIPTVHYRV